MIYQVVNHEKVPLNSSFSNDWQIEYDRDLSSQLSGKSEWTAPEDCWFQYHSIFYSKPGASDSSNNTTLTIQLNGIVVANTDNILDAGGGTLYEITASVLMKKGDVISYKNTVDGIQAPPFTAKCGKIFPVHRILSKDDGHYYTEHFDLPSSYDSSSKILTIDTSQLFKGKNYTPYQITVCMGTDSNIYAFSIIAYKIWNGEVYYSTVMNRTGDIQTVTDKTITYRISGTYANVIASAIKL